MQRLFAFSAALLGALPASAQTFGTDFAADYTFTDLGTPSMVPGPLGGVTFDPANPDRLLIGGAANGSAGAIYTIDVTRDASGHISSFDGDATFFATAPNIDGGLTFDAAGVLFATGFPNNTLMQFRPGSTAPDRTDDLSALGVNSSTGTCQFVPTGFPGAGRFLVGSYNSSDWYEVTLAPDGSGTYDLTAATQLVNTGGGPEGIVFIDAGNPAFSAQSALISEYSSNRVSAYELDAAGNPDPVTRRDFLTGLSGAEGAVVDPLTGDFVFSTFGGGNRVIVVRGFSAPTIFCSGKTNSAGCVPTITFTGTPTATGADDFVVTGTLLPNGEFGALAYSTTPASIALGGGTLCLANRAFVVPIALTGGTGGTSSSDCSGGLTHPLTQNWLATNGFTPGTSVYLQYISRDNGFSGMDAIALSDGLRFTVGL